MHFFCCTERNGLERNSENLHGTELEVFSSAEGFGTELWEFVSILIQRNGIPSYFLFRGTEFRDFLFRGTTGIPSEITICSVYSVFRGIIILSEIPNPKCSAV